MIHEAKVIDGKLKLLNENIFKQEIKQYDNKNICLSITTDKISRSQQQNNYLWGVVYNSFVPEHFDDPRDVHEYFTQKYLRYEDVVDFNNEKAFKNLLESIRKHARLIISHKVVDDKVEIIWIRSTTTLSTKQFGKYVDRIISDAFNLKIAIPEAH